MGRVRKRWAWAAVLAAVGCSTDHARRDTRDDPLLGLGARPPSQPAAIATATPTSNPQPTYAPSPPITPGIPTSNAALAAGGFQPLPGGNDLRIGNGSPSTGAPPTGGTVTPVPPSPDPRPGKSGVTTVGGVSPAPPPNYSNTNSSPAPRNSGLDAAYASVAAVQPIWHRLTYNSQANEYMFSMSVPNRLNSSAPRTVEASAATPEQAIRMALDQLSRDQQ